MKSTFLMILLFWGLNSAGFSAESSQTDCTGQFEKQLKPDQRVSILKKDQERVYGYIRGVKEDSLLISNLDYEPKLIGIYLEQIDWLAYDAKVGGFDKQRAGGYFILGMVLGGAAGFALDNRENLSGADNNSFNPLIIVGSTLVGGAVSYLTYKIFTKGKIERVYIRCD